MSADELRPRRWWYGVAATVAVLGLAAGVVCGVLAGGSAADLSDSVADLDPRLRPVDPDGATEVELTTDRQWAVYAVDPTGLRLSCAGDGLTVRPVDRTVTVSGDGRSYRTVLTVRPSVAGRHTLRCTSSDPAAVTAIGRVVDAETAAAAGGQFFGTVFGIVAAIGLAALGLLVGGAIALVVAVRRSGHRTRGGRTRTVELRQAPD